MRAIRQENVKNMAELDALTPEDGWIVYVEDNECDYLYDGEKNLWIEIQAATKTDEPPAMVRYDADDKIASNKIMFDTVNLNALFFTLILGIAMCLAIVYNVGDVASVLAGVFGTQFANAVNSVINKKK